jgi:hypothetical protein
MHYQPDTASSILAQEAQSYELALLLPVLDLAEKHKGTDGFTITMWMHDGFCVHVHDARRTVAWKARLTKAVDDNASALGIPSSLIWE